MKLEGAVINFLGDSITEGHGTSTPDFRNRFSDLMVTQYGLKKANNYGIGGTRIARQHQPDPNNAYDRDFCARYESMDPNADAVVVFGGTNDFGHGDAPLGTPQDRTPYTFYGACHTLFSGLLKRYPGKPVLIVTPLRRGNEDDPRGDGFKAVPTAPLRTYRDIILEVAKCYSLPVLDLFMDSGFVTFIPEVRQALIPDGLHPNDAGHAILCRRIAEALKLL